MPRVARWSVLFLLVAAGFMLVGQSLRDGEDALIQRQYRQAVDHLRAALDEEAGASRVRVMLLLGRAQWLAGDPAAAVVTYRKLLEEHSGSPLVHKARFQQADALVAAGQQRDAALIYRDEIERLTGVVRKEEIAATYLGLAEKALAKDPADPARAVTFFDLALDLGLSASKSQDVRLRAAEARVQQGEFADAIARLTPLVEELTLDAGRLRAMLALGRARSGAGERAAARSVLRDLIALSPKATEAGDAAYEIALTYGVPTPTANRLDSAVSALLELVRDYPDHEKARVARLLAAQCYRHVGRTEQSLLELRAFIEEEADSNLPELAQARAMVGDVLYAQDKLEEAVMAWRDYLKEHPAHAEWERVQRAIVDAEYRRAFAAYTEGKEHFDEARNLFEAFARAYPLDQRNPDILLLYGEMKLAEEKYPEARASYARCVSKYPGKEASSRAQYRIGEIYESKTFNYLQALRAYRKVTWGSWASKAQQRIALLSTKSLHLNTPRSFRTGDKAFFELTSRNIEKVRVRVFRLDLETYFRATHMADGIDRLDIEVIEPDKTFDSSIPDYQEHAETQREVEVGFDEAGAYVAVVDDGEFEATTMVLITDVALIAKSSRHEFFVFTQNLKEQRPEGGLKVVLSDGKSVLAEGVTAADGVWRYKGEALEDHDDLRVFAVGPAGNGAGSLNLSGLGYSPGLSAKGYLFTDRPVYQPGQAVHIKGVVREVSDGLYRLPQHRDYQLQVLSANGRLIMQRPVAFTAFGTFAADLSLPPDAVLGDWRLRVDRGNTSSTAFTGGFTVAHYERPRLSLTAELAQAVVYRGESITGRFKLDYFFGEPAIGKSVHYTMRTPDGGLIEKDGETNAAGEVPFELPTDDFAEEAVAVIEARVVADNVSVAVAVPVVTTEFTPSVSTMRSVYLTGEPFEVAVEIVDRSGAKLARQGIARLLRYQTRKGQRAEVEVESKPFQTGADGTAKLGFAAAVGGEYVVRVEAEDRFGTTVSGQALLEVSGEDDAVKLRMLTDRESYRVGETVAVRVVNRAGAKLALRTVQGDGILAYEAVRIPAGESTFELELEALHAPNFALALAMIDGSALRTAERSFAVARDLQLSVAVANPVARPGDDVEVRLEARDPRGQPVQAEVALALVDESLLQLYPDGTPAIGAYFYGDRRETAFRTVSSCGWSYRGQARQVSAELIAEERRARASAEPEAPADQPGIRRFFNAGDDGNVANDPRQTQGVAGGLVAGRPQAATRAPVGPTTGTALPQLGLPSNSLQDRARVTLARHLEFLTKSTLERDAVGQQSELVLSDLPVDRPRSNFSESGGWISSVVTDDQGKAVITLPLPHSTTAWRVVARGVTTDTYVGEASDTIRTTKPLQVELIAPRALTEGDRVEIRARAHNTSDAPFGVDVAVKAESGDDQRNDQEHLDLAAHGEAETALELTARAARTVSVALSANGGGHEDSVASTIEVRPFGVEYRDGKAGQTNQDVSFRLGLPSRREYGRLALVIELGPDPGRDLVAAATGNGYRPFQCRRIDVTNLALASRGLAALEVLDYVESAGTTNAADAASLRATAANCLVRLTTAQRDDGSFAWVGNKADDVRTTAQVTRFLGLAKRRGIPGADRALAKSVEWLLRQVRSVRGPLRMDAAEALAAVGRARFELLNALHRDRGKFDVASLARLALAWQLSQRPGLANEALTLLRPKLSLEPSADPARAETVALAARALLVAKPTDATAGAAVHWLQQTRRGASWGTPEATAAALQALTAAGGADMTASQRAVVEVVVNARSIAVIGSESKDNVVRVAVPAEFVKERDNEVRLSLRGRGSVHYSAALTGFAVGFEPADRRSDLLWVRRNYLPAFRRHDGIVLAPGFSVVQGKYKSFENELKQLEVGTSGRVRVNFVVREAVRDAMTPLIVEEPIPAGCSVPRESIRGNFDHLLVEPDRLTFFYREGRYNDTVNYELHARFPGAYRTLPSRFYGAERPDLLAHGPTAELQVLSAGTASGDAYRWTPDELYHLGKALFDAGDLAAAGVQFDQLLRDWHTQEVQLRDGYYKEVARMMLFVSVARNDSKAVVHFFEELKDRYQDLVIPFDKVVAVGKAYIDIGEFERALMVFKGTAEASFLKEAAVAKTLEQLGEVKASIAFLRELLLGYPDLNTIKLSLYSIGQQLAAQAAKMSDGAPVDVAIGSREDLRRLAVQAFREFLVLYPDDPLCEEVSFAWATTHVEGHDLTAAKQVAEAALERYPNSVFEDEMLYTVGYVEFALGHHEEAFALLERVATEEFRSPQGGERPSENRDGAIYLQGQIYHAQGEPAEALALYDKVADKFSDADEAADYFRRKGLSLPEVSTFKLDADVAVAVSYRNIKQLVVKVYRVDLMRLYLIEKSLNNIRGVELHGIRPHTEITLELGDGRDYREKTKEIPLELAEPGAYLVVARGGDLLATGMVLRSNLSIEAQETLDVGRLRVNVKRDQQYLADAHVKVVGSGDHKFRSGDTDLRGIYVADQLVGRASVIVKKGDEYAFFRGKGVHQPQIYQPPVQQSVAPAGQSRKVRGVRFNGWNSNMLYNGNNRARQVEWLRNEVMNKQQQGVEVYRTK